MTKQMIDSNIEWVKEIPKNWKTDRIKHLIESNINFRRGDIDTNVLSLTTKGIVIKEDLLFGMNPENYDNHKMVSKGDYVICLRDLDGPLLCGISNYDGCLSGLYFVLKLNSKKVTYQYFDLMMKSMGFVDALDGQSYGMRHSYNYDQFCELRVAFPSLEEQEKIVSFLETKCKKIDELISKHNLIIEKLDDYRKSIISLAVTNGIDKGVSTKKSKIDYTERVPKHWEMKRLKFVATYIGKGAGITKDDIRENGDTNCVRYGEIYSKYNNTFKNCYSKTNIDLVPSPQYFEYGDILFAGTGELIEEIGKNIAYLGKDKCLAGGDIIVLKHNQEPRYLNYLLNSIPIQNQKSCGKAKLKVVHISGSEIGNIKIYLPDITEQKQIADYLDKKYTVIDELIIKQKEAIDKLEEYKKTLIYNAVTGKMNIDGGKH